MRRRERQRRGRHRQQNQPAFIGIDSDERTSAAEQSEHGAAGRARIGRNETAASGTRPRPRGCVSLQGRKLITTHDACRMTHLFDDGSALGAAPRHGVVPHRAHLQLLLAPRAQAVQLPLHPRPQHLNRRPRLTHPLLRRLPPRSLPRAMHFVLSAAAMSLSLALPRARTPPRGPAKTEKSRKGPVGCYFAAPSPTASAAARRCSPCRRSSACVSRMHLATASRSRSSAAARATPSSASFRPTSSARTSATT